VKHFVVNAATSSYVDRQARLTRSVDDEKNTSALENKSVATLFVHSYSVDSHSLDMLGPVV